MCLGTGLGIALASISDGVGWSAMSYEKNAVGTIQRRLAQSTTTTNHHFRPKFLWHRLMTSTTPHWGLKRGNAEFGTFTVRKLELQASTHFEYKSRGNS